VFILTRHITRASLVINISARVTILLDICKKSVYQHVADPNLRRLRHRSSNSLYPRLTVLTSDEVSIRIRVISVELPLIRI